jgi:hypothetical protein
VSDRLKKVSGCFHRIFEVFFEPQKEQKKEGERPSRGRFLVF